MGDQDRADQGFELDRITPDKLALSPELQERADKFREQVEPERPTVTKEHVKERLKRLADLIQEYRGAEVSSSDLGVLVREAIKSYGITSYGTEMERIESAISRYEIAVETERVRKCVADGLDELFGVEREHSTEVDTS